MSIKEIGAVTIATVVELDGPMFEPARLLPAWSDDAVRAHHGWLVPRHYDPETGLLVMPIQSFVVKTPHHTILVDGCFGNDKERANPKFSRLETPWLERLAQTGVVPEDVDFVLCTHLHGDHVGWNTRLANGCWVPTFPNATYLFAETEWMHWDAVARAAGGALGPHLVDSVLPVIDTGQAQFVGMDFEIEDGVALHPLPGHTPGHVGLHIRAGGSEVILTGDLIHHPIQCVFTDWSSGFCSDPAQSAATRRAFLERYADSGVILAPAHFPTPTFGLVERAGDAFRFRFDA